MSNVRPSDGMQPKIAEEAWVDPSAVVIGDVEIGPGASIWPLTVVRGDIHRIRIGAGSNIQDGSVVHVTHDSRFNPGGFPVCIGERVTVGHKVMLHGCTIGDYCSDRHGGDRDGWGADRGAGDPGRRQSGAAG